MRKLSFALFILFVITLSSCQIIGDIFKAGVGVGVFAMVLLIGAIIFIIAKAAGGNKQ